METFPQHQASLTDLSDPNQHTDAITITGHNVDTLIEHLHMMIKIRKVEEKIGDYVESGKIVCPCHLGIGQEGVATGISEHLNNKDRVFGAHRSHSHYLALGGSVHQLFAEVLGKKTGCSKGMGGSMHLYDASNGFMGSVPIVAGTISVAVGAALAAKKDGKSQVAVSYFGDGACEEGSVHEALNFASTYQLPILFVCENNLFSSHLHVKLRQPTDTMARFAKAHCMDHAVIDGNNITTVSKTAKEFITNARNNKGPAFLEAITYRWRGHVGHREDTDVGVKRSVDLVKWKDRDPVRRLKEALIKANHLTEDQFLEIADKIQKEIDTAWTQAENDDFPSEEALLDYVYAS